VPVSVIVKRQLLEPDQEEKLSQLYPPFADQLREFILAARKVGMPVALFEGLRTMERQKQLYSEGRDAEGHIIDRAKIVTDAPPGMTFHNYGVAGDVVFVGTSQGPHWAYSWDSKWPWKKLGELGQSMGLEAGMFWPKFPDEPHFEIRYGYAEHELLALLSQGGLPAVWKALDAKKQV
jgi:peptidoglycan L-alanyl-D-glutamate endopeptidase CwlK